jgi:hypothetical protein
VLNSPEAELDLEEISARGAMTEPRLECDIATQEGVVKVSFFGGLSLGQIGTERVKGDRGAP